jgi:hypothetical protein
MREDVACQFERDFEAGMRLVWETYPAAVQPAVPGIPAPYELMQALATYFLQFEADGTCRDLYTQLIGALAHARKLSNTLFVTLNYETVLECALARFEGMAHILRPHGGVDYWVEGPVIKGGPARALGAGLHGIGREVARIPRTDVRRRMHEEGKYPAMAIYMPSKLTQMGQAFLTEQQRRFGLAVRSADVAAIVGVRPYPADEHVWRPLTESDALVCCVGNHGEFEEWRTSCRGGAADQWLGPTFEGAIEAIVRAL